MLLEYGKKLEAMYLTALIDYISRENGISLYDLFDEIRSFKLIDPYYSSGIITYAECFSKSPNDCIDCNKIPSEFKRINIMEDDIDEYII